MNYFRNSDVRCRTLSLRSLDRIGIALGRIDYFETGTEWRLGQSNQSMAWEKGLNILTSGVYRIGRVRLSRLDARDSPKRHLEAGQCDKGRHSPMFIRSKCFCFSRSFDFRFNLSPCARQQPKPCYSSIRLMALRKMSFRKPVGTMCLRYAVGFAYVLWENRCQLTMVVVVNRNLFCSSLIKNMSMGMISRSTSKCIQFAACLSFGQI